MSEDPGLSQKITQLADEYLAKAERMEDPAWQDAEATRALLQGLMVGSFYAVDGFQKLLKIVDIDQGLDADGVYNPWVDVTFGSGAKIRVSLEVLKPGVYTRDPAEGDPNGR